MKKIIKSDRCDFCGLKDICIYDKSKVKQIKHWPKTCLLFSDFHPDRWNRFWESVNDKYDKGSNQRKN